MIREYNNIIFINKPLYITILRDNVECFQEMMTNDLYQDDELLTKSVDPKSYEFKELILRDYPPLLSVCAYFKALKIVKYLLMNDVNPHATDTKGRLITHFAAAGGDLRILLILNEFGLDFKEEDSRILFF